MESWSLAAVAALVLGFALASGRLERTVLTAPIVFVAGGLLVGSEAFGWIDAGIDSGTVRVLAEATLTLVLFADASRIDVPSLRRELYVPVRLLAVGLPLTLVAGFLAGVGVLSELAVVEAVVLAIVLAPTDAALGQAVVTDVRLPSRIRQGLNVESGLNDGICVPVLFIALAIAEADVGAVSAHDAVRLVVEEIGWGVVGGVAAGSAGALALRFALRHRLVAEDWKQVVPLASAALAYGIAAPLGGSGFIAAFAGGLAFGALLRGGFGDVTYVADVSGQVLSALTFVVFGAVVLGPALAVAGWEPFVYAVLSLTVVRMAPVALAFVGTGARAPTTAYVGWFGPRGLASIVFAVIVIEEARLPHTELMIVTTAVTVGLSVLAHGVSARPLTDAYAAWYASHAKPPAMEAVRVGEHRWRRPTRVPDEGRSG